MTRARAAGWTLAAALTSTAGVVFHAAWTFALHLLASPAGQP